MSFFGYVKTLPHEPGVLFEVTAHSYGGLQRKARSMLRESGSRGTFWLVAWEGDTPTAECQIDVGGQQ